jgi:hypothetical protein
MGLHRSWESEKSLRRRLNRLRQHEQEKDGIKHAGDGRGADVSLIATNKSADAERAQPGFVAHAE